MWENAGKKWGFKRLYIKAKKKLKAKSWAYKLIPNTFKEHLYKS